MLHSWKIYRYRPTYSLLMYVKSHFGRVKDVFWEPCMRCGCPPSLSSYIPLHQSVFVCSRTAPVHRRLSSRASLRRSPVSRLLGGGGGRSFGTFSSFLEDDILERPKMLRQTARPPPRWDPAFGLCFFYESAGRWLKGPMM